MIAGTLELQMMANMARLASDMETAKRSVTGAMSDINKSVAGAKAMLESLGVGLSIGYFAHLVKGSIDAADHLNDLSKSTNILAGDLAGLRLLAKQNGTDLDGLAKAINRMSVEMGKDPEKFQKLGITAKDNTGALKQFSDLFRLLPDINQRNALAQAVFNKSWAELAPTLSEGSQKIGETIEKGRRLSGITDENAKAADEFNDKWVELTGTGGLLTRQITPLLPLLNALADGMIEVQTKSSGLDGEFHPLAETLRAIAILGGNVAFVLRAIGVEAGGLAAQMAALAHGDLAGFNAIGTAMKKDAEEARAAFDRWEQKMLTVGTTAAETAPKVVGATAQMTAEQKKAAAAAAEFLKLQQDGKDAYEALIKSIKEKIAVEAAEAALGRKLTDAEKEQAELAAKIAEIKRKYPALSSAAAEAKAKELVQLKEENRLVEMRSKWADEAAKAVMASEGAAYKSLAEAQQASVVNYGALIDKLELETQTLFMTSNERERYIALKQLDREKSQGLIATEEDYLSRLNQINQAMDKRDAMAKSLEDAMALKKTSEDIERALTDSIMRGGKNGGEYLKDYFRTLVLRPIIQGIMSPVAGAVNSAMGSAASSFGFSAAGAGFGSGFSELLQGSSFVGPSASLAGGATGFGASVAAATPYIAAALVAYQILAGKGGGPQVGSYGQVNASGYGQWLPGSMTMSGGDPLNNQALTTGVYSQIAALFAQMGKTLPDIMINAGYKLDPEGTAAGRVYRDIMIGGKSIASFDNTIGGKDSGAAAAALGMLNSDELLALVRAIGDPALSAATDRMVANFEDLTKALPAYLQAQAAEKAAAEALLAAGDKVRAAIRDISGQVQAFGQKVIDTARGVQTARDNISQAYWDAQATVNDLMRQAADNLARFTTSIDDFLATIAPSQSLESLKAQLSMTAVLAKAKDPDAQAALLNIARSVIKAGETSSPDAAAQARTVAFVRATLEGVRTALTPETSAAAAAADDFATRLAAAQQAVIDLGLIAEATGAATERSANATLAGTDLLDAYNLAVAASNTAQDDYTRALALTAGITLTTADSMESLTAAVANYHTVSNAFIAAGGDMSTVLGTTALTLDAFIAYVNGLIGKISPVSAGSLTDVRDWRAQMGQVGQAIADGRISELQAGINIIANVKAAGKNAATLDTVMGWAAGTSNNWAIAHGLPAFETGINFVPFDMTARIHRGEAVVPARYNPAAGGAANDDVVLELRALRAETAELKEQMAATAAATERSGEVLEQVALGGFSFQTRAAA